MVSFDKSYSEAFSFIICAFIIGSHTSLKKASYNMMMFLGCYNFVRPRSSNKNWPLVWSNLHTSRVSGTKNHLMRNKCSVVSRDPGNSTRCPCLNEAWIMHVKIMKNNKNVMYIDIRNPNPAIIIHNNFLFLHLGSRFSLQSLCLLDILEEKRSNRSPQVYWCFLP